MTKKKLARIIIEEIKDLLRGRADALNLKSSYKSIERILREHPLDSDVEETPKGGIHHFGEGGD